MRETYEIINEIVTGMLETAEWDRIVLEDPLIKAADAKVSTMLSRHCPDIPKQQRGKIEDAICEAESAYVDAAFLYGMHVAQTIQAVTADPFRYSAYVLDLMKQRETATA